MSILRLLVRFLEFGVAISTRTLEKTIGRNIRVNICGAAMIEAEEEKWIESLAKHSAAQDVDLSVEKLRHLPTALQRRGIMKWLRARNVADVGFEVIERVRSLLDRDARVAKINLPQDRHVRRRAGKIFLE